jgi:ribosomal protein S18 acetylase RimI-like enzyme
VSENVAFKLVPLSKGYYEFVRNLRNNPEIKDNFIEQEFITLESHNAYMDVNSENYQVCVYQGLPIGYIGVVANDIRIAVSPEHFHIGAGTFMVSEIIKRYPDAVAKVKIENESSLGLFEKNGFKVKYLVLERSTSEQ